MLPLDRDNPPLANGGPDRVVQPQDGVTLNGIESHDDNGIQSFRWQMVSGDPYAVIEVMVVVLGAFNCTSDYR